MMLAPMAKPRLPSRCGLKFSSPYTLNLPCDTPHRPPSPQCLPALGMNLSNPRSSWHPCPTKQDVMVEMHMTFWGGGGDQRTERSSLGCVGSASKWFELVLQGGRSPGTGCRRGRK